MPYIPVAYTEASAQMEFVMGYACPACGWMGRCVVPGKGVVTGLRSGEHLTEAAQRAALRNAGMRRDLARCPGCSARSFASFRNAWLGAAGVLFVIFGPLTFLALWLGERRSVERDPGEHLLVLGAINLVVQLFAAVRFALELRAASRVRFLREDEAQDGS